MKARSVAFAVTFIVVLAAAESAARSQTPPPLPSPEGSYRQACFSHHVERRSGGRYLIAVCPNARGERIRSWLRLPCAGDIGVDRGRLVCRPAG